ncbi:hypothetical protein [Saccharothrix variisporea]|uniref:hypothetical protein n=1 Tax=Saccharothrix variisporea TaxID=543527 RepID=UPI0011C3DAE5|nr:hypothetical protein [Saccharothrix variisporea]
MWLLESLSNGFDTPVRDANLQVYRMLLAAAVLIKIGATAFLGDWNRFRPGGFGRYVLERQRGVRWARFLAAVHKPLVVARGIAAVMLFFGVAPKIAALIAAVGFLHELSYEYRFNTIYISLSLLCLLPAGRLGDSLSLSDGSSSANTWSQFLIVLLTADMYWNSAYHKVRSSQFVSGLSLAQLAYVARQAKPLLPMWEYAHPPLGATRAAAAGGAGTRWRVLAVTVVVLEVLIPVGLLVPETRSAAIAAGVALHMAFLGILPLRLAPFTLATLAAYLVFVP